MLLGVKSSCYFATRIPFLFRKISMKAKKGINSINSKEETSSELLDVHINVISRLILLQII